LKLNQKNTRQPVVTGGRVVKRFFFYISETKGEEKTGIGWFPFTIPKTIEVY